MTSCPFLATYTDFLEIYYSTAGILFYQIFVLPFPPTPTFWLSGARLGTCHRFQVFQGFSSNFLIS